MKKKIVITGGAGFVGTNLIKYLLKKTKFKLVSIDNYSSGSLKNHQKSSRVKYIKGDTKDIDKILKLSSEMKCNIITTEKDYLRLDKSNSKLSSFLILLL